MTLATYGEASADRGNFDESGIGKRNKRYVSGSLGTTRITTAPYLSGTRRGICKPEHCERCARTGTTEVPATRMRITVDGYSVLRSLCAECVEPERVTIASARPSNLDVYLSQEAC